MSKDELQEYKWKQDGLTDCQISKIREKERQELDNYFNMLREERYDRENPRER